MEVKHTELARPGEECQFDAWYGRFQGGYPTIFRVVLKRGEQQPSYDEVADFCRRNDQGISQFDGTLVWLSRGQRFPNGVQAPIGASDLKKLGVDPSILDELARLGSVLSPAPNDGDKIIAVCTVANPGDKFPKQVRELLTVQYRLQILSDCLTRDGHQFRVSLNQKQESRS